MRHHRIGVGICAVTTLALLAGCGGSAGSDSDGPKTITFAASMLGEPTRGPQLTALLEKFNASQDDYVIEPVSIPFASFGTTIFTQLGQGKGPDVIAFDQMNIYEAADAKLIRPLDDVVKGIDLTAASESLVMDDHQWGVPLDVSNYALIYNPDLVKKPPTTFEEFKQVAREQTTAGRYGFAFRTTQAEEAGVWYDLSNFVYGAGGAWSDDAGNPTINSPQTVAGVKAFADVYQAGVIPKGSTAADYRRMFATGKVAMMIDNGGIPTVLRGTNPDIPIAAAPAPFPTQSIGQVMAAIGINANTRNAEAAEAFVRWFLGKEAQTTVQGFLGGSLVATPVERTTEELTKSPFVEVFDAQSDHARSFIPTGLEVETPRIRSAVVQAVLNALQSGGDIQQALDGAQDKAKQLAGK
jgi:multiple sugar transport system substrate-binding protein